MKRLQHILEYIAFLFLGAIVRALPLKTVQSFGSWMGEFAFQKLGFRRDITLDNLRHAFPEKSEEERMQIARASFRGMGTTFMEFLWFPRLTPEAVRSLVPCENCEVIVEAHAKGKGVILMTAHFGSWELCAQGTAIHTGLPVSVIVKPQSNRYIDAAVNQFRTRFGNRIVPMGESVKAILRALQQGELIGIIADQSAPKESPMAEFFGRKVPTFQGPAAFGLKTGAIFLMGFAIRRPDGKYRMTFERLDCSDLNGYTPENAEEVTRRHVRRTEEMIRRYPEQWMWMHRRWKHAEAGRTTGTGVPSEAD